MVSIIVREPFFFLFSFTENSPSRFAIISFSFPAKTNTTGISVLISVGLSKFLITNLCDTQLSSCEGCHSFFLFPAVPRVPSLHIRPSSRIAHIFFDFECPAFVPSMFHLMSSSGEYLSRPGGPFLLTYRYCPASGPPSSSASTSLYLRLLSPCPCRQYVFYLLISLAHLSQGQSPLPLPFLHRAPTLIGLIQRTSRTHLDTWSLNRGAGTRSPPFLCSPLSRPPPPPQSLLSWGW